MRISLFGLTIDKDGAVRAIKEVTEKSVQMAKDGAKAAQDYSDAFQEKLNRVSRQYIPETMRAIDALRERQRTLTIAAPVLPGLLSAQEVARSAAAYDAMIAAQKGVAESSGMSVAGLGRVRQGLTSLVARLTDTIPAIDRLGSTLAAMSLGNVAVVGILAGLAAIAYAYRKLTADTRAQSEAIDKLTEAQKKAALGPAGDTGVQLTIARTRLQADIAERTRLEKELDEIRRRTTLGNDRDPNTARAALLDTQISILRQKYGTLAEVVRKGEEEVNRLITESAQKAMRDTVGRLIGVVSGGDASPTERARLLRQMASNRRELAYLNRVGGNEEQRIALRGEIDRGMTALYPRDRDAERDAKELQKAADKYFNEQNKQKIAALQSIEVAQRERQETERRIVAVKAGAQAERDLTDAIELEKAKREFLAASDKLDTATRDRRWAAIEREIRANQALGHSLQTLEDERQRQQKIDKELEDGRQHAAQKAAREAAQESKRLLTQMQTDLASFFGDIFTKGIASFADLFARIKNMFLQLLADMIAASLVRRVAGALGGIFGMATTAGAQGMGGAMGGTSGGGGPLGAVDAWGRDLLRAGGAAVGGAAAGYGMGRAMYSDAQGDFGNYTRGALGGAAAGALVGTMILPGIGTAVGAVAGLVGGIIGIGSAAKESNRRLDEMRRALALSMDALRADARGDVLSQQIVRVNAEREQMRKAIEDAYPGRRNEGDRNRVMREMNALQDERVEKLRKEYALQQQYAKEDLAIRKLRAEGKLYQAEELAFAQQQQREYNAAVLAGRDATYLAMLAETQRAEAIAHTNQVILDAVRNAPSGFKVAGYGYDFSTPRALAPTASLASGAAPVTFDLRGVTFQIKGATGDQLLTDFAAALRKKGGETVGANTPLSRALDRL